MSAVDVQAPRWSETAIARLENSRNCPRCDGALEERRCPDCGADYREIGGELWQASQAAAAALRARQEVLERVPVLPLGAPAPAKMDESPAHVPPVVAEQPVAGSSATVQSVLAVSGAGLVAVAAIVFTFFNPDLTDSLIRGLIVGGVTVGFLIGAWALARRRLQFSAEAVGALGMIFLGLDVHALTALAPQNPWAIAAAATAVAGAAMTTIALRVRIRVWLWTSMIALSVVPAMVGYAADLRVLGHFGTAAAAFALIALTARFARRFEAPLRSERATLTIVQVGALSVALGAGWLFGDFAAEAYWLSVCGLLAASATLALFSTRHPAPRLWSWLAGAFGTAALTILPFTIDAVVTANMWWIAVFPAAAVTGAIVVAVLMPVPRSVGRGFLAGGALGVVAVAAISPVLSALMLGMSTVLDSEELGVAEAGLPVAVVIGLGALAAGLGLFAWLDQRLHPETAIAVAAATQPSVTVDASDAVPAATMPIGTRWVGYLGLWFAVLAGLTLSSVTSLALGGRIAIGLALAACASIAVARSARVRASSPAVRTPLVVGAHFLVLMAGILSWRGTTLAVSFGPAIVATIALLALAVPVRARFLHVGAGYAYALVVFATALSLQGIDGVAQLCLTTSVAALVAIGATFLARVRVRSWYAILVVTSVPFLAGVAQVLFERSGWTALSTGLIFLLALTLVVTRRPGLGIAVRLTAASLLVPSLAVVAVCLGAQLLTSSGSPVVLPVIATIVALVLPSGGLVRAALVPRIGERDAALARIAIEASTLLTGAIAVSLAIVREAAGLPTTFLVLVILGVGGAATSLWGGRRYGWALAAAAFTGALWSALGIAGIDVLEPYLLPPALGAAIVGALLTLRGVRGLPLYAAGLVAAVLPLLVLTAVTGPPMRAYALVAASWLLLVIGRLFSREQADHGRLRVLGPVTLTVAIIAGAAGAVQAARFGLERDQLATTVPFVLVCIGIGLAGAVPAAAAARALRRQAPAGSRLARTRWLYAPAFGYVAVAAWPSISADWFAMWSMWTLMIAFLIALVAVAQRGLRSPTGMPPVWFIFGLAFVTAVVAWSPRELRVEWFSLPLGAALLLAGALAMARTRQEGVSTPRSVSSWPAGWSGSWALLLPGIAVIMSASIAATFTDPRTWRAILVIVLALVAILVGASLRLAAPFLIGIVVLPLENAIAFLVQIGRGIESMPWWITLAVVGAVLLIIAVTYERRAGAESGIAARLRDLG